MFKNYLTIAIRNLLNHKVYSLINISGLAIGIACCIPILLYVQHELNYESHIQNQNQIYRILLESERANGDSYFGTGSPGALTQALKTDFPEIESVTRTWTRTRWIRHGDQSFQQNICRADPSIFDIFNFPLTQGDPKLALSTPGSMLITQETAQKFFGTEDPIGKTFTVDNIDFRGDYIITAILKNIPENTRLRFDFLTTTVGNEYARQIWEEWIHNTSWRPLQNYIRLSQNTDVDVLQQKLYTHANRYRSETATAPITYHLQPLSRIHLYTRRDYNIDEGGDIASVYVLLAMAGFILLIACVNFTNLATARSARRAREVGLRKVVGAHRRQLIRQFLGESVILAFIALTLALALTELILPTFNDIFAQTLSFSPFQQADLLLALLGVALFAGLAAGFYPALFLSSFRPSEVLKSASHVSSKGFYLRKGLVVFQFTISIFLIVGTIVVRDQMTYIQNKNLGFDKSQVIFTPLFYMDRALNTTGRPLLNDRYNDVKQAFLQHPNILKASASRGMPGSRFRYDVVLPEGKTGEKWQMHVVPGDEDFLDLFGIELIAGRNLSSQIATDATKAYILNEAAVKALGWEDPIGKKFEWIAIKGVDRKGQVIGVVKDFHMSSLHEKISPAVICMQQPLLHWLSLKMHPENTLETLAFIEQTSNSFASSQ